MCGALVYRIQYFFKSLQTKQIFVIFKIQCICYEIFELSPMLHGQHVVNSLL